MFAPLKDLAVFRSGRVDPEAQTVVWPNGADVAPEVWSVGSPKVLLQNTRAEVGHGSGAFVYLRVKPFRIPKV